MQSQTVLNTRASDRLLSASLAAITRQMEDLKQVGPEWDGPGSITPEADVIDRVAAWLIGNWRADLGIPDICPTAEGGVSISWEWGAIEHSIDVRAGGASMEWRQYNPSTLQTVETELPMDKQGWGAILAGLNEPTA